MAQGRAAARGGGEVGAAKVEREAGGVHHDLDHLGARQERGVRLVVGDGAHAQRRVGAHRLDQARDRPGLELGLVALQVEHDVRGPLPRHLGHAVGAAGAVGGGHLDRGAEAARHGGDALVVGGDHQLVETAGGARPLPDVLEHGLAPERGQRLAGEARRREARGDDGEDGVGARGLGRAHGAAE